MLLSIQVNPHTFETVAYALKEYGFWGCVNHESSCLKTLEFDLCELEYITKIITILIDCEIEFKVTY